MASASVHLVTLELTAPFAFAPEMTATAMANAQMALASVSMDGLVQNVPLRNVPIAVQDMANAKMAHASASLGSMEWTVRNAPAQMHALAMECATTGYVSATAATQGTTAPCAAVPMTVPATVPATMAHATATPHGLAPPATLCLVQTIALAEVGVTSVTMG